MSHNTYKKGFDMLLADIEKHEDRNDEILKLAEKSPGMALQKQEEVIQYCVKGADELWHDANFESYEYRVKPEPAIVQLQIGTTTDGKFLYTFENPNLELEFIEGKLVGAKVL